MGEQASGWVSGNGQERRWQLCVSNPIFASGSHRQRDCYWETLQTRAGLWRNPQNYPELRWDRSLGFLSGENEGCHYINVVVTDATEPLDP